MPKTSEVLKLADVCERKPPAVECEKRGGLLASSNHITAVLEAT